MMHGTINIKYSVFVFYDSKDVQKLFLQTVLTDQSVNGHGVSWVYGSKRILKYNLYICASNF